MIKNFSIIDHYFNLGSLNNVISFPSTLSISSGFLNYIHFSKKFILRRYLDDFNGSVIKFLFFKFDEFFLFLLNFINKIPAYLFVLFRMEWIFSYNFFDFILYFFFIYLPFFILLFLVFFYKKWFLGTNQSSKKYVEDGDGKFSLKEDFSTDDSQVANPLIPYKVDQFSGFQKYNNWRIKAFSKIARDSSIFKPITTPYTDYSIKFRRKYAKFYKLSYLAQLRFSKQKVYGKKQKLVLSRYSNYVDGGNKLKDKKYIKLRVKDKFLWKKDRFFKKKKFIKEKNKIGSTIPTDFFSNTRKHNFFIYDSYRVSHMFYGDWFFKKTAIFRPTQRSLKSSLFLKKKLRNMLMTYRKSFYSIKDFMIRQKLSKHFFEKKSVLFGENDFSLNFGPSEWYSLKFEFLLENKFFVNLKNYYNSCFDIPSWSPLRSFDLLFLKFFHKNKSYCSDLNYNRNIYLRYKYTFYKAVCSFRETSITNWSYFFGSYSDALVDDVFSGIFSSGNFLDFFYIKEYPNYISLYKNGLLLYRFDKLSLFSSKFNLYSKNSLYMLKGTKRSSINVKRFFKDVTDDFNAKAKSYKAIKNKKGKVIGKTSSVYNYSVKQSSKLIKRLTWSGKRGFLGHKLVSSKDSPFFSTSLSGKKRRLDNYRYVKRYYYDFYEKNSFLKYLEDNYRLRPLPFWWSESIYLFFRVCFVILFFFVFFLLFFKFFFFIFKFLIIFKKLIFFLLFINFFYFFCF